MVLAIVTRESGQVCSSKLAGPRTTERLRGLGAYMNLVLLTMASFRVNIFYLLEPLSSIPFL